MNREREKVARKLLKMAKSLVAAPKKVASTKTAGYDLSKMKNWKTRSEFGGKVYTVKMRPGKTMFEAFYISVDNKETLLTVKLEDGSLYNKRMSKTFVEDWTSEEDLLIDHFYAFKLANKMFNQQVHPETLGLRKVFGRTRITSAAFSLDKSDKKVIDAFLDKKPGDSKKMETDGKTLDISGMGGKGVAKWVGGKIDLVDLGSRSGQTVHRYIKKQAPANWLKVAKKDNEGQDDG